ncbi:hypothetical protein AB0I16_17125 [Streptomyces sp. NPDC050703]|uniref:hypothetical protein n=1 Tax=Streptomyces sp. NPDC050703 TaxID=3157218 RepID=UPI003434C833
MAVFGLCFAVFAKRLSRGSAASSREIFGTTGGSAMRRYNRGVFAVVGSLLAVFGIAYAAGLIGS